METIQESKSQIPEINLRYFKLKEDYVFAQLSTEMTEAQFQKLTGQSETTKSSRGKAIFLALDKSGSMSGTPFKALQEGSIMIGKQIYENQEFEHIITCFYDQSAKVYDFKTYSEYEALINREKGDGPSTNFVSVFDSITQFIEKNPIDDLSVIFFTDGQENANSPNVVSSKLEGLKNNLVAKQITSRFLTIGLTTSHDAPLLNKIAQAGTELGNFFYVDTSKPDYPKIIEESLQSSLSMAFTESGLRLKVSSNCQEFTHKLILEKSIVLKEEEEKKEESTEGDKEDGDEADIALEDPNQLFSFNNQLVFRDRAFDDLEVVLIVNRNEKEIKLVISEYLNPSPELQIRAQVKLINQMLFNLIQEVQKKDGGRTNQEVYEDIKLLEKELDQFMEQSFKIKEREVRKQMIQEILEIKEQTRTVMELLRNNTGGFTNAQIAQLNDLGYRAVRKKGLQKKLDERAIKNEAFYKKLDNQIKHEKKKVNKQELREKYKDIIELVGSCALSCNDTAESIEQGDCMCLALEVKRNDACIADPTQLIIKKIIPTFISADSFLDSAAFMLKDDDGGINLANKDNLAQGLGREKINGVMPLYLFQEHWNISRRKAPPVYGFICTLDVMGYASSQYFTIPFLVLLKALENEANEDLDINKKIKQLVLETCQKMMASSQEFRDNCIKQVKDFFTSPEFRTVDIVASIPVMLVQLYTLTTLDDYQQYLGDWDLDTKKLQVIFRFALEEQLRRNIVHGTEPLTKDQILRLLLPNYMQVVTSAMEIREQEIIEEVKPKGDNSQKQEEDNEMAAFKSQANIFRSLDPNYKEEVKQEEQKDSKKEEGTESIDTAVKEKIDIPKIINDQVQAHPWQEQFTNQESNVYKLIQGGINSLTNKNSSIILLANLLNVSGTNKKLESIADFPLIENDDELMLAIFVQNAQHPKNSHRTEAIKTNSYKELLARLEATKFLSDLLSFNLKIEFSGKETIIRSSLQQALSNEQAKYFIKAPDQYYAAAVLSQLAFYMGRGDRTTIMKAMLQNPYSCPAIKDKLRLLYEGNYRGQTLFKDDTKVPLLFGFNHRTLHQIFKHIVLPGFLSDEDYVELFPKRKDALNYWRTNPNYDLAQQQ